MKTYNNAARLLLSVVVAIVAMVAPGSLWAAEPDHVPGSIDLNKGTYHGPRVENAGNVGYVRNDGTAAYPIYVDRRGSYNIVMDVQRYGTGGTMHISIRDKATGRMEVSQDYTIASSAPTSYTQRTIELHGTLAEGEKTMTFSFSDGSGYILNYRNLSMAYRGMEACIGSVGVEGLSVIGGEGTDWLCRVPIDDTSSSLRLTVEAENADVAATAVDGDGAAVSITAQGANTFTLPTPAKGRQTTVTFAITPRDGAVAQKTSYTLSIVHLADIAVSSVNIDGDSFDDLASGLNSSSHTATLSGRTFTVLPTVLLTLNDGSTTTATGTLSGTTASYVLHGQIGNIGQDYQLLIEGVHAYTADEADQSVSLKYTEGGKSGAGKWTDGLYTLTTNTLDGWENSSFKLNGSSYTLSVPADIEVTQIIFRELKSNYRPTGTAAIAGFASDGAIFYVPSHNGYSPVAKEQYDLVINVEGHKTGEPINFTISGGGQPTAWIELTTRPVAVTSAPRLLSHTISSTEHLNRAIVTLTFDRAMRDTEASVGNAKFSAEGGSAVLLFRVNGLNYGADYDFTVPAGAARDNHGNGNAEPIVISFHVGEAPTPDHKAYDYVVSTVDEWKAALQAVNRSNSSSTAPRKVIFIKNGDYDFGAQEQRLYANNVSLIGESRDGVIIHGNRTGISNPVLNLRDRSGFYVQDITVRNDLNYGMENKGGVAVAIYGGNKTAMKNVRMLSNQDTQVTGSRAYFEGCEIHGTVDFICGGGNNYYAGTDLVIEDRGGCVIAAPSTSADTKWGYVFQGCRIKRMTGATRVQDGGYNLGRPWQNEPRAYYLNTIMEVIPSDRGWTNMSNLPTHFYEYNSMRPNGSKVDLSKRGNSPSSTNHYKPVLTDEQARKFTLENVLSGNDYWLPTELTHQLGAVVLSMDGNQLSWNANDSARTYAIFLDGKYVDNTTATSFTATANGSYTVRAANQMGGLGAPSNAVSVTTGISTVGAKAATASPVYDLEGRRVARSAQALPQGAHGIYIVGGKKVVRK